MKGLALIMGKGKPPVPEESAAPAEESDPGEDSKKEFARIASEAMAAGDHEAAADALVSLVEACNGSYGPGKK